jgi:hypothetical protein
MNYCQLKRFSSFIREGRRGRKDINFTVQWSGRQKGLSNSFITSFYEHLCRETDPDPAYLNANPDPDPVFVDKGADILKDLFPYTPIFATGLYIILWEPYSFTNSSDMFQC